MEGQIPARHLLHSGYHHPVLRKWQSDITITPENLMFPVFVTDDASAWEDIASMPEQKRVGVDNVKKYLDPMVKNGLKSVIVFGVVPAEHKDPSGVTADHPNGPVIQTVKLLKKEYPELLVACDVCLCPYTSHGHCGILREDGHLDNHASIDRLAQIACNYARAGADIVAPSDMMDGRIKTIKDLLIAEKLYQRVSVMSYSAKFASAFYGPFRDAAKSAPSFGDRKCYQLPPGARGLARRAIIRDVKEGADIIMVKPGYPYLDIVHDAKTLAENHPIAVYQVSGEYSMLYHAGVTHGVMNLKAGVIESIDSYMRAGATIIITYWTPKLLEWLKSSHQ